MRLTDLDRLRAAVLLCGLTQRQIAAQAGVSPGTVGNLLAGRRTGCSLPVFAALLHVVGPNLALAFELRTPRNRVA